VFMSYYFTSDFATVFKSASPFPICSLIILSMFTRT